MIFHRFMSRRTLLAGAAGAAGLALTPSLAPPVGASSTAYRRINSNGVRFRSGPGLGFEIMASLAEGTEVLYLEPAEWSDGYEWAKIQFTSGQPTGYVAAMFLSPLSAPGEFPIGSMVHVDAVGGRANLRAQPNGSVIRVVNNGLTGSVADGPIVSGDYTWFHVNFGDVQGWMASVVLSAGGGSDRSTIEVASGPLNVRDQAGLSGSIIGVAPGGAQGIVTTEMPVTTDGYTWINVQFESGLAGWIASEFVVWV